MREGKWFNKCIKMNFYLFSHNDDDDDQFICYNECMLVSPYFFFVSYLFIYFYLFIFFEKEDCQLYKLKAAISA